jgi:Winged helix DNA-binding domain
VHLLPGFDEYMLGYSGRSHQLGEHLETYGSRLATNGMLAPTIMVDGRAVGIWRRTLTARTRFVRITDFRPLTAREHATLATEHARCSRFMGHEAVGH